MPCGHVCTVRLPGPLSWSKNLRRPRRHTAAVWYNLHMVCFTSFARRIFPRAVVILCLLLLAAGCNYHGRIKRGIYQTPSFDDKIEARVMVVADKYIQHSFTFKDRNLTPINAYIIRVDDGAAVAAADALGTLFSEVDVNLYKYRRNYDYIAELDYKVEEDNDSFYRPEAENGLIFFRKYIVPKFHTYVILTLRDPHTRQPIIQLAEDRVSYLSFNNTAIGIYWLNKMTLSLLFPVMAPAYTSAAGNSIRKTLEEDLRACLRRIMKNLEENRVLFMPGQSAGHPRNDGPYRKLLEKTLYVETPAGHGTGFFISPNGYFITNAHVVENYRDARYYLYEDLPIDPHRAEPPFRYARVVKVNHARDLALLKAEGNFPYFKLDSDRSHYKTGENVLALGNPKTEQFSVTKGIISALKSNNGLDVIQTDAAISSGNSGGPLVLQKTGEVVGVNQKVIKPHLAENIGFAITAFEVKRTLDIDQPIDEEKLRREEVLSLPQTRRAPEDMYQNEKIM